jgi:hypothetical protein
MVFHCRCFSASGGVDLRCTVLWAIYCEDVEYSFLFLLKRVFTLWHFCFCLFLTNSLMNSGNNISDLHFVRLNMIVDFWVLITVAARSKAWTVFALSNTEVVGSNSKVDMDVCVRLFCVCVVLCLGSGLATGWSPVKGVLPNVYGIGEAGNDAKAQEKGWRAK